MTGHPCGIRLSVLRALAVERRRGGAKVSNLEFPMAPFR